MLTFRHTRHGPRAALRRARGVTLIETLIALGLTAIVMMIAVPDFSQWMANSRIRGAAESIQDGLRFARAEAVRLNTPVRFQITSTASDWTVCLPAAAGETDCNGGTVLGSHSANEGAIGITTGGYTGGGNPYATPAAAGTPNGTTFTSLGWAGAAGDLARVDITNGALAAPRWMVVNISASGQISMCDPSPLVATSNPLHCE
jgi:type IV fimbrial biogenesis protein FimT